jgi:Tol biopolymer transport system component
MKPYLLYLPLFLCALAACGTEEVVPSETRDEWPVLFPDYTGVTVPASIAPLNFRVEAGCEKIDVVIEGSRSGRIHLQRSRATTVIPPAQWRRLLAGNAGDNLNVRVSVKQSGRWIRYGSFPIHVSAHPVDYGLVYRLIPPGYEVYGKMGIYERSLSDFTQTALIENTLLPGNCVNCHSFRMGDPAQMSLHIRGTYGSTAILSEGRTNLYNTKTDRTIGNCVYPYWHPSGQYIAYSVNETRQVFHEQKDKRVEVVDARSDIAVYHLATNELITCPQLGSADAFETFPAFSPDGRALYFCSAEARPIPNEYSQVRYNLCRIAFDPESGSFGQEVDTLVYAAAAGKSVSFPRPSYDGKYLMYALSDYGNFSIWHTEADLWLLDPATGESRALSEVNSADVESYHSWSSNSRWFVFSSRRMDGLYTRPYLASIDEAGRVGKPFLLPQEDPAYYESSLYSFNIPEFVTGPVRLNAREVEKKALSGERIGFR